MRSCAALGPESTPINVRQPVEQADRNTKVERQMLHSPQASILGSVMIHPVLCAVLGRA
jgi:hypothetical protein